MTVSIRLMPVYPEGLWPVCIYIAVPNFSKVASIVSGSTKGSSFSGIGEFTKF
ncbi:hypothetical protein [Lacticaseibacillus paracasei]|uniref:hypothetical protein n=1 Tax=Lacticaseibacillus paracasei TaxID=1597 RepID=UPI001D00FED1|nr:hypothetical protein [Lacticaseibacillus paracasei]MDO5965283.1 hypothetical protein [Lacticaseibacillus paracasei]